MSPSAVTGSITGKPVFFARDFATPAVLIPVHARAMAPAPASFSIIANFSTALTPDSFMRSSVVTTPSGLPRSIRSLPSISKYGCGTWSVIPRTPTLEPNRRAIAATLLPAPITGISTAFFISGTAGSSAQLTINTSISLKDCATSTIWGIAAFFSSILYNPSGYPDMHFVSTVIFGNFSIMSLPWIPATSASGIVITRINPAL